MRPNAKSSYSSYMTAISYPCLRDCVLFLECFKQVSSPLQSSVKMGQIVESKNKKRNVHFLHAGQDGVWPACECPDETSASCPGNYESASHPKIYFYKTQMKRNDRLTLQICQRTNKQRIRAPDGCGPYVNVFATLPKSFSEQGDHVFMIVEELLNELAVASFCFLVFDLKDGYEKLFRVKMYLKPRRETPQI